MFWVGFKHLESVLNENISWLKCFIKLKNFVPKKGISLLLQIFGDIHLFLKKGDIHYFILSDDRMQIEKWIRRLYILDFNFYNI